MTRSTLVMLPGLLCDETVWRAQCTELRLVDCVVPSFGSLSSLKGMAEHVLATATAHRFALAGHSMGARVALEVLRLAPERVERLALMDTGLDPIASGAAGQQERAQRSALLSMATEQGMMAMARQWARGMVHPAHLGSPVFEEVLAMVARSTPAIFEAQINALINRPDARDVLASVACPTLLLCGRQDEWSPLSRHEAMKQMLPTADLVIVEDSGHMTPMEQPHQVSNAIKHWLSAAT